MKTYYVTISANMPMGCGYWEINAPNEGEARRLAFQHCPEGRWSLMYLTLEDIHPLDRMRRHGVIGPDSVVELRPPTPSNPYCARMEPLPLRELIQARRDRVKENHE